MPEELYDLKHDPDCLHNLIAKPNHQETIDALQAQLIAHMKRTGDPMLKAFLNRTDRAAVDKVLLETYGPLKESKKRKNAGKKKKATSK